MSVRARGRELLDTVEDIYADVGSACASTVGAKALERLRADLVAVLAGGAGQLAPVRPTW